MTYWGKTARSWKTEVNSDHMLFQEAENILGTLGSIKHAQGRTQTVVGRTTVREMKIFSFCYQI